MRWLHCHLPVTVRLIPDSDNAAISTETIDHVKYNEVANLEAVCPFNFGEATVPMNSPCVFYAGVDDSAGHV